MTNSYEWFSSVIVGSFFFFCIFGVRETIFSGAHELCLTLHSDFRIWGTVFSAADGLWLHYMQGNT